MGFQRNGLSRIAGTLTATNWQQRRDAVQEDPSSKKWGALFDEFFKQRIETRYLNPIEKIQKDNLLEGEGFSIVTIQCALIEFLAACREGKKYRSLKQGETLGEYEYRKSGDLFVKFLSSTPPFNKLFLNEDNATEFYKNVRCALLHEARTKNGWRIQTGCTLAIDFDKKIIDRSKLHDMITRYIDKYRAELIVSTGLQDAFIRKFDDLADGNG